jgi:hypothetical protein
MERKIKEQILKDYKTAQKEIERILNGDSNFFVKSIRQYLAPTIVGEECSFTEERGELSYYTAIRNKLEIILKGRKPDFSWHFNDAPDYVKQFLE